MKTVWKYKLRVADQWTTVDMPLGARIVHVGVQDRVDQVCLWAVVDPDAEKEPREFTVLGTGDELRGNGEWEYVGTAQTPVKSLVWHVWEWKAKR